MKILLFGGSGQLGHDLRIRAGALNFEIISPVSSEIDIADREQVHHLVNTVRPQLIVNSAAYTQVDKAEEDSVTAFAVNRDGARYIAEAALSVAARMFHLSTDYVYDGDADTPITEDRPTSPINVYGQSKLEGEQAVRDILPEHSLILRTAWLHGSHGKNFVQTMIKLFQEKKEIRVVNDQFGSPTWTGWLAEVILDLSRLDVTGVLHAVCGGSASWYDFAKEVYDQTKDELTNVSDLQILPQSTEDAKRPAARPRYSVLDCTRLSDILGRQSISWQSGLSDHLKELGFLKD